MNIKEISINNYRLYYGENKFPIASGLTLFVGDNGDGKSTFFDAVRWLLNTSDMRPSYTIASAMKRKDLEVGESAEVSVSMTFEHFGKKYVKKGFKIIRSGIGMSDFRCTPVLYDAYAEEGAERQPRDGAMLINSIFDAFLQTFSLFKGESDLNVFNNLTAFRQLIEWFSELKQMDRFVKMTEGFESDAKKAYDAESSKDRKMTTKTSKLNGELEQIRSQISGIQRDIDSFQETSDDFGKQLELLEEKQDVSSSYHDLKTRKEEKDRERTKQVSIRNAIDLNHALLDRFWILCAFMPVLKEFQEKSAAFDEQKRRQNDDFQRSLGERKGKREALAEVRAMMGGKAMLSWDIPDINTMKEMLRDEICKVCGHPAPKGSKEYEFMKARIEEYERHLEPIEEEPEQERLFIRGEVEAASRLGSNLAGFNASRVAEKAGEITGRLSIVSKIDERIRRLDDAIKEAEEEMNRLLVNNQGLSADLLEKSYRDISSMIRDKRDADDSIARLKRERDRLVEDEKAKAEELERLAPSRGMAKVYKDVYELIQSIHSAFQRTKDLNRMEFLENLEKRANAYLDKLNAYDFHGIVRLVGQPNDTAVIRLYGKGGDRIEKPSGSQETAMYLSVLFGISDLTTLRRDENYPLIFDAATSSFGDAKSAEFYNVVNRLNKQCIILTKDFIDKDGNVDKDGPKALTCPVYRIYKQAGFDKTDESTLRTLIERIN